MNEVMKAIKGRRSVRAYAARQVSQEELDLIIEAGTYAPTAHNQQPWHFSVIQNEALLERVNETCRVGMAASGIDWMEAMASKPGFKVTYGAPTLVIVSGRKDALAMGADCAAAIQNMLLMAESLGVGSVWLGLVRFFAMGEGARGLIGIPEGFEYFYGVAFGYPADPKPRPAPRRNPDVVNYVR
jgi:nitroreductase